MVSFKTSFSHFTNKYLHDSSSSVLLFIIGFSKGFRKTCRVFGVNAGGIKEEAVGSQFIMIDTSFRVQCRHAIEQKN